MSVLFVMLVMLGLFVCWAVACCLRQLRLDDCWYSAQGLTLSVLLYDLASVCCCTATLFVMHQHALHALLDWYYSLFVVDPNQTRHVRHAYQLHS